MTSPARRPDGPQGQPSALWARWVAIAGAGLGAVVIVAAAVGLSSGWRPLQTPTPTPSTTPWTYPSTPPPSAAIPDATSTPTPTPPAASSLKEFVAEGVDSFDWSGKGDDSVAIDEGAVGAKVGTYASNDSSIGAAMAEWKTPEDAAAHAKLRAERAFPGVAALGDGPIAGGAGHYWYFERDGKGTVFWYHGRFSAEFSGDPMEVQEFFLRFPR